MGWHRFERLGHHLGDLVVPNLARGARTRFIVETIQALPGKSPAPCPNCQPRNTQLFGNRTIVKAVGCQEHDLGPHRISPANLAAPHPLSQLLTLAIGQYNLNRHAARHLRLRINSMDRRNHDARSMPRNF
jgi:hypothetical protein